MHERIIIPVYIIRTCTYTYCTAFGLIMGAARFVHYVTFLLSWLQAKLCVTVDGGAALVANM